MTTKTNATPHLARRVHTPGKRPTKKANPPLAPSLDIEITGRTGIEHAPYLRRNLLRAHAILNPPLREFSLALVGDRRMAELHEQFMSIPGPTDVLTFELDHDARGRVTAGEVVVCVPYARREAARRRISDRNELLLYALHGMLHLCGYDDRTDRDFSTMHRREDDILSRLGVGAVFARPAKPPTSHGAKTSGTRVTGAPKLPRASTPNRRPARSRARA